MTFSCFLGFKTYRLFLDASGGDALVQLDLSDTSGVATSTRVTVILGAFHMIGCAKLNGAMMSVDCSVCLLFVRNVNLNA